MGAFIKDVKKTLSVDELQYIAKVINYSYDPFNTDDNLWDMLSAFFAPKLINKYKNKMLAHEAINDILLHFYPGERIIKYYLTKEFLNRQEEITLFEMYISKSRLDVGRINGESYAYEIKTNLDNLNKLSKQVNDYSKAFEHVNVIADKMHIPDIEELLPEYCGIITYELNENSCSFFTIRTASKSPNMSSEVQLGCLSSKDYQTILKHIGIKEIPKTKEERRMLIYQELNEKEINENFKNVVKYKYQDRWRFVCECFNELLPIDMQTFFSCKIDPKLIYYKQSFFS